MTETIILLLVAIFLILSAVNIFQKFKRISKQGIEAEGIVFELKQSITSGTGVDYPIVRFVTKQKEWITTKSDIGTIAGLYKKGERVIVVYMVDDPYKFYIKNNKTYTIPFIMIAIAIILIIIGVIKLFLFN